MRSALPPFGFGFCVSCTLVPPLAALAPTDHTTTTALEASVTALPQSLPPFTPMPLWQTYRRGVEPRLAIGRFRKPFMRVNGVVIAATVWLEIAYRMRFAPKPHASIANPCESLALNPSTAAGRKPCH